MPTNQYAIVQNARFLALPLLAGNRVDHLLCDASVAAAMFTGTRVLFRYRGRRYHWNGDYLIEVSETRRDCRA